MECGAPATADSAHSRLRGRERDEWSTAVSQRPTAAHTKKACLLAYHVLGLHSRYIRCVPPLSRVSHAAAGRKLNRVNGDRRDTQTHIKQVRLRARCDRLALRAAWRAAQTRFFSALRSARVS